MMHIRVLALILAVSAGNVRHLAAVEEPPSIKDDRLQIQLFARDPEIVTPVGISIDSRNRLYVVESHTHTPNKDYSGPKEDRVKRLIDRDRDGRCDEVTVFAGGLEDAMNLAFAPSGDLYVCQRAGVVALYDRDGDGTSESRQEVLRLETNQSYDHSCLLGIAFSPDGWMYVSRGNVGGHAYTIRGSDGSAVSGYRDGGNIVRCRPDGSQVELVATGFWNPFGLKFDPHRRLLCVDNDPDARGPNRLLHIIQGGDYGFQSHYGPSGLHPFNAWDGELPGTLPMIAGTGEAPSGLLCCNDAALPGDYTGNLLVTIWGEHTIERFQPRPRGSSLVAKREVLVQGGREFRPVGIAAGSDGSIYVTDWVRTDYPNHGAGRIWRIRAKPGVAVQRLKAMTDDGRPCDERKLGSLIDESAPEAFDRLMSAATDDDPFIRSAACFALSKRPYRPQVVKSLAHSKPKIRLAALLALRRAGHTPGKNHLCGLLADESADIRRIALIWTVELRQKDLASDLKQAILKADVSAELLETYLAARQAMTDPEWKAYEQRQPGFSIRRSLDPRLVDELLLHDTLPSVLQSIVLARVTDPDRELVRGRIIELAHSIDDAVQREAIRTLSAAASAEAAAALEQIAFDQKQSAELRADAVQALSQHGEAARKRLVALVEDREMAVQLEVVRGLQSLPNEPAEREALVRKLVQLSAGPTALDEQIRFALSRTNVNRQAVLPRPTSDDAWWQVVAQDGDPSAGRRVFFDARLKCSTCHRVAGRGGQVGPDLTVIGRSSNRRRLLDSILHPSAEIAPQFQMHRLLTADGREILGIQFHFRDGGKAISIIPEHGREVRFRLEQIEEYEASPKSLMPDGLVDLMTVSDVRNLLAYLESLR